MSRREVGRGVGRASFVGFVSVRRLSRRRDLSHEKERMMLRRRIPPISEVAVESNLIVSPPIFEVLAFSRMDLPELVQFPRVAQKELKREERKPSRNMVRNRICG